MSDFTTPSEAIRSLLRRLLPLLCAASLLFLPFHHRVVKAETVAAEPAVGSQQYNIPLIAGSVGPLRETFELIDLQFGWPRRMVGDAAIWGRSTTFLDLDLNLDWELSLLTTEGRLYVYQHDGARYPGFPLEPHHGDRAHPWRNPLHQVTSAAGDVDGDEWPDLVYITDIGYLHVVGERGDEPESFPMDMGCNISAGVPALIDIDGDREMEIVFNTYPDHPDSLNADAFMHIIRHTGLESEGWPVSYPRGSSSSPAVGDIDLDGLVEILIGSARYLDSPAQLWAWHQDATRVEGFPTGEFETIGGTPALAEISGYDEGLEVLMWAAEVRDGPAGIFAWNGWGQLLDNFPFETSSGHPDGGPVLADLNGDELPEVVFGTYDPENGAKIYAWELDGELLDGFPIEVDAPSVVGSVLLADVSGDGQTDVVAALAPSGDEPGRIGAWNSGGEPVEGFPLSLVELDGGAFAGTPTIWDVDRDGDLELVAVTTDRRVVIWDTHGRWRSDTWPTLKGGMTRTGMRPIDDPFNAVRRRGDPHLPTSISVSVHPNPFNRSVRISLDIVRPGLAEVDLFDLSGRRVERLFTGDVRAGRLEIALDAAELALAAGIYLCRWRSGDARGVVRLLYIP